MAQEFAEKSDDIIALIRRDHRPIIKLIQTLKKTEVTRSMKAYALEQFVGSLLSHAKAEEKSLYVHMKNTKTLRTKAFEGEAEHTIAEELIHDINATPDDDDWNAKVKVLAELVEHHIEEEENEMLPQVEGDVDYESRKLIAKVYTQIKSEFDMLNHPVSLSRQNRIENHLI